MKPSAFVLFTPAMKPVAIVHFTAARGWRMTMARTSRTDGLHAGQERELIGIPGAKRENHKKAIGIAIDILETHYFHIDRKLTRGEI